jgi:hypothetical protein
MLRFTGFSASFSHFRAVSVGTLVLATIACSDNTSPAPGLQDGVNSVEIVVPDSLKAALSAQFAASLLNSSVKISANVLAPAFAPVASLSAACGSGNAFAGYQKSQVAFAPEAAPSIAPAPLFDDGYLEHVPLGFSFSFYGSAYDEVNVYSNGLVMFGPAVSSATGFFSGDLIPFAGNPNNMIALAWTDWSPQKVAGGIRYETRGQAPNRRFIVQFSNVPEFGSGTGRLTSQLVLNEGSNDITLYTSTLSTTKIGQRITQGIENAAGTQALFDSVQNVVNGVWAPRVKNVFKLTNDAIRFSLISSKDEQAPSITPAADVSVGNDPGLASAVVAVASPSVADNCSDVTISSTRSDNAASDAPYPVGVTTITWTAADAAGNFASAAQKITVLDVEAPVFGGNARSALAGAITVNATSPSGAVVTFDPAATDNVGVTALLCEPASGSVFPVGSRTVTCSASDAAGNSSSKSFSVSVIGAREQLANLMEYVKALGLPNGTANPLINQLKSAYSEQGNECKKMSDFIEMVSKKSSDIDPDDAAYMTAEANRIRGAFGCAVGGPPRGR